MDGKIQALQDAFPLILMSATALTSHPESVSFFLLAVKGAPKVSGTDADVQAMSRKLKCQGSLFGTQDEGQRMTQNALSLK